MKPKQGDSVQKPGQRFFSLFSAYIEYILLILISTIAVFFYSKGYFSYIFLVIAADIGIIIYIFLKKFVPDSPDADAQSIWLRNGVMYKISSIIFFIFFTLSIISLLYCVYSKTFIYYACISICTGITAVEVLYVSSNEQGMGNLVKSLLITLNITLSNQLVFPEGIGLPDTVLHFNRIVTVILDTGFIPLHTVNYEYFPGHHLFSAIGILLGGSDPKITYFCLGGFVVSLGVIFVYLIGKRIVDQGFGLFSAVLFPTLDYYIMYGSHPEHQAYNYAISVILFTVILLFYFTKDKRFMIFSTIIIVSMVFTHHFSAIIVLAILGSLILVELFHKFTNRLYHPQLPPLLIIFGIILLIQWIYYSNLFHSFIGIIKAYTSAFQNVSASIVTYSVYNTIPLTTILINSIGSALLLVFALVGFIVFCKKKEISFHFIIAMAVTLSVLLGGGIVLVQLGLLPDRLYPYLQVFGLVFLAAGGVVYCLRKIKSNAKKIVSIFFIFLLLSFFSIASTIAGFETSLFVDENLAYFKLFSAPQERYFQQWQENVTDMNISMQEIPLTPSGLINQSQIMPNSIVSFDQLYLRTGFVREIGYHMGYYQFIKLKPDEINKMDVYGKIYSNGIMNAYKI